MWIYMFCLIYLCIHFLFFCYWTYLFLYFWICLYMRMRVTVLFFVVKCVLLSLFFFMKCRLFCHCVFVLLSLKISAFVIELICILWSIWWIKKECNSIFCICLLIFIIFNTLFHPLRVWFWDIFKKCSLRWSRLKLCWVGLICGL